MKMNSVKAENYFNENISKYMEFDLMPSIGFSVTFPEDENYEELEDSKSLEFQMSFEDSYKHIIELGFNIFREDENYLVFCDVDKIGESYTFHRIYDTMDEVFEFLFKEICSHGGLNSLRRKNNEN